MNDHVGMKTGIELIAEERQRQIEKEGYTVARDTVRHIEGELVAAALCYAAVGSAQLAGSDVKEWPVEMFNGFNDSLINWPWDDQWYKPSPHAERNLVMAGALIAAELDRIRNVDAIGRALEGFQE